MVMSSSRQLEEEKEEMQQEKGIGWFRRMFVGIVWKSCAGELKLLLSALLFLCSLATLLQFLPSSRFSVSPSDIRHCLSTNPTSSSSSNSSSHVDYNRLQQISSSSSSSTTNLELELLLEDDGGVVKRGFKAYGSASYNFIFMSAYRGGPNTFAVVGLSSKPLHLYGKPTYQCQWLPHSHYTHTNQSISTAAGHKILPDWGYGRVYTVVVVNCTFPAAAGAGRLLLHASTNDPSLNVTDTILALDETPQDYANFTLTSTRRPRYDYLYCGSSLYGNLSPQRMREWLAYHVRLLGARSHFVIHDAGGVHEGLMRVLRPWMEKGFVTLQDIREQERFDGYYHNQFLIVNDCLHRYRFQTKWMFFFDVDEFIFVPDKTTITSVLDSLSHFTQFTIEQMPMSNKLCLSQDAPMPFRKWGFEKLVYKDVKRGIRRDRKYAVQPRNVFATGVHLSQNIVGKTTHNTDGRIKYFHYHGTIAERREPCRQFLNSTGIIIDGTPYVLDTTMRDVAGAVKRFELKMIGSELQQTRQ